MATFSRHVLSGSTNGKAIKILGATTSGGTLVHTAYGTAATGGSDEVWLWAHNYGSTGVTLTLRLGGTASQDSIAYSVPGKSGLFLVSPGLPLNNNVAVRAYCSASNHLGIVGYVNRVAT